MGTSTYHDVLADLRAPTRELRRLTPEAWAAFGALHAGAFADGALPGRIKELVALAIAVAERCDGCIASHARSAARLGATPEEVAELLAVCLLMGGGPASIYAPRAWDAFLEFVEPAASDDDGVREHATGDPGSEVTPVDGEAAARLRGPRP